MLIISYPRLYSCILRLETDSDTDIHVTLRTIRSQLCCSLARNHNVNLSQNKRLLTQEFTGAAQPWKIPELLIGAYCRLTHQSLRILMQDKTFRAHTTLLSQRIDRPGEQRIWQGGRSEYRGYSDPHQRPIRDLFHVYIVAWAEIPRDMAALSTQSSSAYSNVS